MKVTIEHFWMQIHQLKVLKVSQDRRQINFQVCTQLSESAQTHIACISAEKRHTAKTPADG